MRFAETLKEKAELEEPSSQCRETSDRAGQPVAISLRIRIISIIIIVIVVIVIVIVVK